MLWRQAVFEQSEDDRLQDPSYDRECPSDDRDEGKRGVGDIQGSCDGHLVGRHVAGEVERERDRPADNRSGLRKSKADRIQHHGGCVDGDLDHFDDIRCKWVERQRLDHIRPVGNEFRRRHIRPVGNEFRNDGFGGHPGGLDRRFGGPHWPRRNDVHGRHIRPVRNEVPGRRRLRQPKHSLRQVRSIGNEFLPERQHHIRSIGNEFLPERQHDIRAIRDEFRRHDIRAILDPPSPGPSINRRRVDGDLLDQGLRGCLAAGVQHLDGNPSERRASRE